MHAFLPTCFVAGIRNLMLPFSVTMVVSTHRLGEEYCYHHSLICHEFISAEARCFMWTSEGHILRLKLPVQALQRGYEAGGCIPMIRALAVQVRDSGFHMHMRKGVVYLSVYLFICPCSLHVCQFVCLSVCLSVHRSVSSAKNLEISTFIGLNSCCTRQ